MDQGKPPVAAEILYPPRTSGGAVALACVELPGVNISVCGGGGSLIC